MTAAEVAMTELAASKPQVIVDDPRDVEISALNARVGWFHAALANSEDENISLKARCAAAEAQLAASHELLQLCLEQATGGLGVEHDCPAMFACACIVSELTPPDQRIDAALAAKGST